MLNWKERGEKTAAISTVVTFNLHKKYYRVNHLIFHNVIIIDILLTNFIIHSYLRDSNM